MEGRLTYRDWTTEDGEKRTKAEIHLDRFNSEMKLMDSKSDNSTPSVTTDEKSKPRGFEKEGLDDFDDDSNLMFKIFVVTLWLEYEGRLYISMLYLY